jgi:hypothetical protein
MPRLDEQLVQVQRARRIAGREPDDADDLGVTNLGMPVSVRVV